MAGVTLSLRIPADDHEALKSAADMESKRLHIAVSKNALILRAIRRELRAIESGRYGDAG